MTVKHKNFLVYGMSVSGEWVAKLLAKKKANVFLFDDDYQTLKNKTIKDCYVLNELNENFILQFDYIVVSPSIERDNEYLKIAREGNIKIFSEHKPLNSAEREALDKVALKMVKEIATPCTACRYCTEHCPKNLDIPTLLSLYGKDETPKENGPENCIGCKSCEKVCPQGIKISEVMTDFATRLENA